ncbi:MAG: hypothetical protein CVU64_03280 [Deltaproteobacteria bacterium HGW-Deltaproteobacteria-21]|jgi:hypothetical protein|nr:MAG: hypothetical protein CVU64_03280 [Deltaproteobacteria bacterium HGW-Deltaproteobacteria-21]
MGFVDRILGRRADPTEAWLVYEDEPPSVDLSKMAFGPLRFGAELQEAQFLGKPDSFKWSCKNYCELLYARRGFQIDFENGKLCYLAFFIGQDDCLPKHPALKLSKPQIRGGVKLTQETCVDDLRKAIGPAESADADDEETILTYCRSGITLEFEVNTKGLLKRWNLYPRE